MILDYNLRVSNAQAVTASAGSTDCIDLGSALDIGISSPLFFAITCSEAATAAGAATMSIQVECDSTSAFSTPKILATTDAFGKAVLTIGREPIYIPIPPGLNERYVRLYYTVATGPLTAGKFSASVVTGIQSAPSYSDFT